MSLNDPDKRLVRLNWSRHALAPTSVSRTSVITYQVVMYVNFEQAVPYGSGHESRWRKSSPGVEALRKTAIVAACATFLLMTACDKAAPPPPAPPVVDVMTVVQKDVPIYSEWVGSLDGDVNATIRPQVTGYLVKQNYREGDAVKKGQILFEIDPRTFQAAVEQAAAARSRQKAMHDTAVANLARIKPLAEKNAVSQKDLDDATGSELSARAALDQATAALDTARLNLDFTRITSPINGIAGIAKAQIGDLLSPSATAELTTVSTVDPIKVYVNISEREYLKFSARYVPGKAEQVPLEMILWSMGSVYPRTGRFTLLNRQVDPTTGTFKVAGLFPTRSRACVRDSSPRYGPRPMCRRGRCWCPAGQLRKFRASTSLRWSAPTTRLNCDW
ncbi:efflux RND transporter periplasmic adaptor subunit [Candidatus Skiveiella danica]|uniref:efflux RND transporter periplasmic adaptor subunit n=1 Tax=Candidatus Skiveiella danica TaxID=3386177 RepID=UPI0039B9CCD7